MKKYRRRRAAKVLAKSAAAMADEIYRLADLICEQVSPEMAVRVDHAYAAVEAVARDLRGWK